MTISQMLVPPCPSDDEWWDYRPGGMHEHARSVLEAFWKRVWQRWQDINLCRNWWDYRFHYSMDAWTYGFQQMFGKEKELETESIKLQRRFEFARRKAGEYDANPELCKKLAERKKLKVLFQKPPAPVVLTTDKREWWARCYEKARAAKTG